MSQPTSTEGLAIYTVEKIGLGLDQAMRHTRKQLLKLQVLRQFAGMVESEVPEVNWQMHYENLKDEVLDLQNTINQIQQMTEIFHGETGHLTENMSKTVH